MPAGPPTPGTSFGIDLPGSGRRGEHHGQLGRWVREVQDGLDVVGLAGIRLFPPNKTEFRRTMLRLRSPGSTVASVPAAETPVRHVTR